MKSSYMFDSAALAERIAEMFEKNFICFVGMSSDQRREAIRELVLATLQAQRSILNLPPRLADDISPQQQIDPPKDVPDFPRIPPEFPGKAKTRDGL